MLRTNNQCGKRPGLSSHDASNRSAFCVGNCIHLQYLPSDQLRCFVSKQFYPLAAQPSRCLIVRHALVDHGGHTEVSDGKRRLEDDETETLRMALGKTFGTVATKVGVGHCHQRRQKHRQRRHHVADESALRQGAVDDSTTSRGASCVSAMMLEMRGSGANARAVGSRRPRLSSKRSENRRHDKAHPPAFVADVDC